MLPRVRPFVVTLVCAALVLISGAGAIIAQNGATSGEWRTYGGNLANSRYAPLDQINKDNFSKLQVAWRQKTDAFGPGPEFNLEATPLMANGVLYTTAGTRRAAIALDAATGEIIWVHTEREGARGSAAPRLLSGRGLSYWTDGREERILYVTPGYRLIALDAKTGSLVTSFGKNGVVDLKLEDDQTIDLVNGEVGLHATPTVAGDVVIIGAAHRPGGSPRGKTNVKGYVRAFDVRTGKRLWIFHTIPLPGEFGNDTWEKDSWSYTGNAGVWGQMSVDEELGLVYLPVELPTGDYYGGHRPGAGLFGESIVAVELKTGKRRWHYQLVHHGLWDMDIPCAPMLVDITVNGRSVKALAQPTKQAFLYMFDRTTGQPIWPIEERPVAKGDVPGEWYSPTQPFPTKPPPYDRQGVSIDDLIDFTPALRAEAVALAARYRMGPMFTPPSVSQADGTLATLVLPSQNGGTNWPGGSYDPETHVLYVFSKTEIAPMGLVPQTNATNDWAYPQGNAASAGRGAGRGGSPPGPAGGRGAPAAAGAGEGGPGLSVQGLPLAKPPYGRISAFNLDRGELLWQVVHGETPDAIRDHPALKGLTIPRTGQNGYVGLLTTKTLLIAGEPRATRTSTGQRGAMLRAYDKTTGAEVGAVYMPAPQTGSPMTYMLNGQQYLEVAIGGPGYSAEFLVFKLPS